MTFDPEKHHRRSIRLRNYDYSQPGAYFVTICTYQKQSWFGEIKNGQIYLNQLGKIVADEWLKTCKIRPNFKLDEWVIMPNHFHGIVIINDYSGDDQSLGARDAPLDLGARDAPLDLGARDAPLIWAHAMRPYSRNRILYRHVLRGLNRRLLNELICFDRTQILLSGNAIIMNQFFEMKSI
ncbi:hypothetical protein PN472_10030 [Microcystis aeruginosa CS-1036]|uniref:transposase n=1 Tax=Microcystis aeruginosa TaxID=1126 RepID=UPI00233138FE|nr:transposase [Microcystis aeruginosa]MDB9543479.1 hypothetical protein [Microcystis aeruginosa CS-1036]